MAIRKRLYRPGTYQELSRISKKWMKKGLGFCDFVLRAYSQINPDYNNEPDDNASTLEFVRGYLTPIPLRYRQGDIRQFIDNLSRPDKYATAWAERQRIAWNSHIEHKNRLLYPLHVKATETYAPSKRYPQGRDNEVIYTYLKPLHGSAHVTQLDGHIDSVVDGLNETKENIQGSRNTRSVERSIEERLRWQENLPDLW